MQIADLEIETPVWTSTPLRRGIEPLAEKLLDKFDCYIAGGYARWLVTDASKDTYTDIDVFFPKQPSDIEVAEKFLENNNLLLCGLSPYALSYVSPTKTPPDPDLKIQLIKPVTVENTNRELCGPPKKVMSNFDFTVCQAAYYNGEVIVSERFLEDEEAKRLRIASVEGIGGYEELGGLSAALYYRMTSYYEKGYTVEAGELLKFLPNTWMDSEISRRFAIDLMKLPSEQRITRAQMEFFFSFIVFKAEWKDKTDNLGAVYKKTMEYPL